MLQRLDSFLLDAAQKFCDKVQRLTGLTKFRLEKWSLITATATFVIYELDMHWTATGFVLALVMVILTAGSVLITDRVEKIFLMTGELIACGWEKFEDRQLPLLFTLCISIPVATAGLVLAASAALLVFAAFTTGYMYFSACVPLPPRKSKARQWYENGLTWLNEKLESPGVPVRAEH